MGIVFLSSETAYIETHDADNKNVYKHAGICTQLAFISLRIFFKMPVARNNEPIYHLTRRLNVLSE